MSRLRRFSPSGSMLVALLALVMATTGSAVAASLITSKQIKNGTIQTKDMSKKAQKSLKGKTGARGATGPQGPQGGPGAKGDKGDAGTNGTSGTNGTNGADGEAVAYGTFAYNVGLTAMEVPAYANAPKNMTAANVDRKATGVYCLKGLPFTPASAVATGDNSFAQDDTIVTVIVDNAASTLTGCAVDEKVRIRTYDVSTAALADRPFTIWLED